jgi:hypothetical protein
MGCPSKRPWTVDGSDTAHSQQARPPTCRMPLGQSQDMSQAYPEGRVTPRFWHHLIRFRHFIGGSLALASLNLACRDHVPTFPQRSPPSLLTTAACGGLRSTPDCRPRRALLHLSYSCIPPCGPAILVTQDPTRTSRPIQNNSALRKDVPGPCVRLAARRRMGIFNEAARIHRPARRRDGLATHRARNRRRDGHIPKGEFPYAGGV